MSDDRLTMPPMRDFRFYQHRKHDTWRMVDEPSPALERAVSDSHAHVHMLPDPAWELVRCAAANVHFVCEICDPSEDDLDVGAAPGEWLNAARRHIDALDEDTLQSAQATTEELVRRLPALRVAAGVHPHNARLYDDCVEERLMTSLAHADVLGEVGLDYHYDLSPRDEQRRVFRRQIAIAHELDKPLALHLRGGDDAESDAHREAFAILEEEGALGPRTLLHCCTLGADEIRPWVEADCFIAFGGAITFASADAAREGAALVPENRLLIETDSPYMTPVPMRGSACTPSHIIFTAAALASIRGFEPGPQRAGFLERLDENARTFFGA